MNYTGVVKQILHSVTCHQWHDAECNGLIMPTTQHYEIFRHVTVENNVTKYNCCQTESFDIDSRHVSVSLCHCSVIC